MRALRFWLYIIGAGFATGCAIAAAWQREYFPAALFAAAAWLYLFLLKGEERQ